MSQYIGPRLLTVKVDLANLVFGINQPPIRLVDQDIPIYGIRLASQHSEILELLQLQFDAASNSRNGIPLSGIGDGIKFPDDAPELGGMYLGLVEPQRSQIVAGTKLASAILRFVIVTGPGMILQATTEDMWRSAKNSHDGFDTTPAAGQFAFVGLGSQTTVNPAAQAIAKIERVIVTSTINALITIAPNIGAAIAISRFGARRRQPWFSVNDSPFGIAFGSNAAVLTGGTPGTRFGVQAFKAQVIQMDYELQTPPTTATQIELLVESQTPDARLIVSFHWKEREIA